MEATSVSKENLISYVSAKYGSKTLGCLKLLSSLPHFRSLAEEGKQYLLVQHQMLSREQLIKEHHGVWWKRVPNGCRLDSGCGPVEYEDDQFGSVAGAIAHLAYEAYPQYSGYLPTPVVQMGHGANVPDIMEHFDVVGFGKMAELLTNDDNYDETHYGSAIDDFNNNAALLDDDPYAIYDVFEAVHRILVLMRLDKNLDKMNFGTRVALPYASKDEEHLVYAGMLKKSVKSETVIPESICKALSDMYGGGTKGNGGKHLILYEDDPFLTIGSKKIKLPVLVATESQPKAVQQAPAEPKVASDASEDAAIELIEKYLHVNLNALDKHQKIVAWYGSVNGKRFWEELSDQMKKNYLKSFSDKKYTPIEWIRHGANHLATKRNKLTEKELYMLVAGRVVANQAQLAVNLSGDPPYIEKL